MKKIICTSFLFFVSTGSSQAALIGSELSLETTFQSTPTSAVETIGFLTTAIVADPGIEFSSLASTEVINPPLGLQVIDVSIDAGNNFIDINFSNSSPFSSFSSAYQNGYLFTFDSASAIDITGASIDSNVTTLGLTANDLVFTGNQLFVNVEGLSFNTSTFARINLTSEGGISAVPLPSAVWLMGSGLIGLAGIARRKKAK